MFPFWLAFRVATPTLGRGKEPVKREPGSTWRPWPFVSHARHHGGIPDTNKQAFIDHAGKFDPIFLEFGATCDAGMEKFMQDPRMQAAGDMHFDGKRMIYGGFAPVVELA